MKSNVIFAVIAAMGLGTVVAAGVPLTSETSDPQVVKALSQSKASSQRAINRAARNLDFEAFKNRTYKEPFEGGGYIVDGDVFIPDEDQLRIFYLRAIVAETTGSQPKFTIAVKYNGFDDIWDSGQRKELTYCVSKSFGANYDKVVQSMAQAASSWERAAAVDFKHVSTFDANCNRSTRDVVFDVRPVNVQGAYLARAFFPSYGRGDRNVLIDASAISLPIEAPTGTTLTGVLRHELGHTLGARHEHTRPESGTCFEDQAWRPVTNYDAFSVMHYPQCNGRGDWTLRLTELDKNGVACVYGAALGFSVNPNLCQSRPTNQRMNLRQAF
jgi:serine protease